MYFIYITLYIYLYICIHTRTYIHTFNCVLHKIYVTIFGDWGFKEVIKVTLFHEDGTLTP